jgi:hypothetical protein
MTWTPEPGMSDRKVQRELQRQAILFEERVQSGEVYDGSMKLSDFIPVWFQQHVAQNLAPKTQQEY